jgi:hypothetical protein
MTRNYLRVLYDTSPLLSEKDDLISAGRELPEGSRPASREKPRTRRRNVQSSTSRKVEEISFEEEMRGWAGIYVDTEPVIIQLRSFATPFPESRDHLPKSDCRDFSNQ